MIAKLFTTLVLIFTLLLQNICVVPVCHKKELRLKAVLISDIHADADGTRDRTNMMREIFAAIGRTQNDADAVVMSGDLTNSGDLREYMNLQNCLNAYCRIPDRVPEMGNHDSWHHSDEPDYQKAERYFKAFCLWNGICTDTVYYQKCVKGIPFIVLGVEDCDFGEPYHSEAQLDWFEETLFSAVAEGKPVFVVCHKEPDGLGDSAGRVAGILTAAADEAAAPIIYVSGHHHQIGDNTFAQPADMLVYLNLPSVEYTGDGGLGFVAEIYDDEVILTGMDFLTDEPLEEFTYAITYSNAAAGWDAHCGSEC